MFKKKNIRLEAHVNWLGSITSKYSIDIKCFYFFRKYTKIILFMNRHDKYIAKS